MTEPKIYDDLRIPSGKDGRPRTSKAKRAIIQAAKKAHNEGGQSFREAARSCIDEYYAPVVVKRLPKPQFETKINYIAKLISKY